MTNNNNIFFDIPQLKDVFDLLQANASEIPTVHPGGEAARGSNHSTVTGGFYKQLTNVSRVLLESAQEMNRTLERVGDAVLQTATEAAEQDADLESKVKRIEVSVDAASEPRIQDAAPPSSPTDTGHTGTSGAWA